MNRQLNNCQGNHYLLDRKITSVGIFFFLQNCGKKPLWVPTKGVANLGQRPPPFEGTFASLL